MVWVASITLTNGLVRQTRLRALLHKDIGDLLSGGGHFDLMSLFSAKSVLQQLKSGCLGKRHSMRQWAARLVSMLDPDAKGRGVVLNGVWAPLAAVIGTFSSTAAVVTALVNMVARDAWALPLSKGLVRVGTQPAAPATERTYPRLPAHHKFNVCANEVEVVVALEAWIHQRWHKVYPFTDANVPSWAQYPIEIAKFVHLFLLTKGGQAPGQGLFNNNPAVHVFREFGHATPSGAPILEFAGEHVDVKNPGTGSIKNDHGCPDGGPSPVVVGGNFRRAGEVHRYKTWDGRLRRLYGLGVMRALEVMPAGARRYQSQSVNLSLCDASCTDWDAPTAEFVPAEKDESWWSLETDRTKSMVSVHDAFTAFITRMQAPTGARVLRGRPLWTSSSEDANGDQSGDDSSGNEGGEAAGRQGDDGNGVDSNSNNNGSSDGSRSPPVGFSAPSASDDAAAEPPREAGGLTCDGTDDSVGHSDGRGHDRNSDNTRNDAIDGDGGGGSSPTVEFGVPSAHDGTANILRCKTSDTGVRMYLLHDPTSDALLWTDAFNVPTFMLAAFKTNSRDRAFRRRARDLERGATKTTVSIVDSD